MLAEGFLRLLCYREERKFATICKQNKLQTSVRCANPLCCTSSDSRSADPQAQHSVEAGPHQELQDPSQAQGLRVVPQVPGLLIPGCSPVSTLHPVCIEDCSLLEQYPDLQVADSGRISYNPLRVAVSPTDIHVQLPDSEVCPQPEPQNEPPDAAAPMPDQGYLVMGASVNISLDLPGSGLEPMSNSVLNGLLEKQLEEVYMQHLTDNLARCNSQLENSLLRGLVLPPQPDCHSRGPDSLEASLEDREDSGDKISYLNTHNLGACSSNFSSPVLRISETDSLHPQGNIMPKY